jgi:glycosyltransferase involved in cell wall biosynthesis
MSSIPATDIIIPFHATNEFRTETCLEQCIKTLIETTHNFRLIFVDDNSDDIGREKLHQIACTFPECVVVRTYKQRWFTRATNLGFRLVRTPWCVELNSDVILGAGWLEELYAVKDELECAGGKVGLVGSVYAESDPRRYILTYPPNFVTGHAWLVNMEAAQQVGKLLNTPKDYLDETTSRSIHIFSDNHFCYHMNQLGWQTAMALKSGVGHVAGKSWGHKLDRIPSTLSSVEWKYGN